MSVRFGFVVAVFAAVLVSSGLCSVAMAVEGERITQEQIASGDLTLREIRRAGLRMFASRFTTPHGYGDGPVNVNDTITPGGRPTLGGNGSLLRINGLDAQSCVECHSVIRADTMPPTFGIGGVGGSVTNAMIQPTEVDPADQNDGDGNATFNGRFANPPFIFGAGAVELLGLEMTMELQAQREQALAQPGVVVELTSKGVSFGTIVAEIDDTIDTIDMSNVRGIDSDLVVKPFGRKGEFATVREFDIEAMRFHFGMEPIEAVGAGFDNDRDGIVDEVLVGELSALSAFVTTIDRPQVDTPTATARSGLRVFNEVGCGSCHISALDTNDEMLPLRFPEVRTEPTANAYLWVDLTRQPMRFETNTSGGVRVPLFADLKRHDMGEGLAESFDRVGAERNREFTTARLWGIADTAPYLHDGRASTLFEAIDLHGGEAQTARDTFVALDSNRQEALLAFLRTLRTPEDPLAELLADPGASDGESRRQDGSGVSVIRR